MQLNCLIVDDELMARKSLERLTKKVDFLQVVRICENGKEALAALEEEQIDLIFLDIEMPELTGIDFLNNAIALPQVIFTTSNTDYAFDAFEYEVTDFLKKPIAFPRFKIAVEKAWQQHQRQEVVYKADATDVYLRVKGRFVRVSYQDIRYFENMGDYVKVVTPTASYVIHGTIKGIESKLNTGQFLKVHRSFIVNMNHIKDIEENTLVIDRKVIPISRANKQALMGKLNLL